MALLLNQSQTSNLILCIHLMYFCCAVDMRVSMGPLRAEITATGVMVALKGYMEKSIKAKKNSQLVVRINDEQRDRFVSLCEELDTSAAREVRRFIRQFLAEHEKTPGKHD